MNAVVSPKAGGVVYEEELMVVWLCGGGCWAMCSVFDVTPCLAIGNGRKV